MALPFRDRRDAGRQLAALLRRYANRPDVVVLGLPRGGVPVAAEIAAALGAPLDVMLVRKLGVPGHEELAMGAIASGGLRVLNDDVVADLRLPPSVIDAVEASERRELGRRERLYRGGRGPLAVRGKTVLLVDDGLATGSTLRAAARALRQQAPARIVGAVPVGSPVVCAAMREVVDEMVCAETPEPFYAVGLWYEDFGPTPDAEVQALLRRAEERGTAGTAGDGKDGSGMGGSDAAGLEVRGGADRGGAAAVQSAARPLLGGGDDYDGLLAAIGDARFVLLGEASHGTHEFYRERARITRRLIEERGFAAVAVEADWPDAYRVNRYVRGAGDDPDAQAGLGDFHRFPRWMWRNADVLDFVEWLRAHNDALPAGTPTVGFYGLDLYSLGASIRAVLDYLAKVDPEGERRARARYACFDHFGDDPQAYGYATSLGLAEPCENEAVGQLVEMQRRAAELARRDGRVAEDEYFFAEQNARLAKNAEAYYRAMFRGRVASWNLRDRHMTETLEALVPHLERHVERAKVVVWAHNSHLGDARATEMGAQGELNVGQLVRERFGPESFLVGFTTYTGTVTAATDWDAPARRRTVRPALPGSYEDLLHEVGAGAAGGPDFWLDLRHGDAADRLRSPRLERAIGVVYRPETERFSHYFQARLVDQFDAVLHFDQTAAVVPLDPDPGWEGPDELPETFPFGV